VPPQQSDRPLDVLDDTLNFRAHRLPVLNRIAIRALDLTFQSTWRNGRRGALLQCPDNNAGRRREVRLADGTVHQFGCDGQNPQRLIS
jgi:hypothetical protein